MIRLLLLFFSIFISSTISMMLMYGSVALIMFWISDEMGFFSEPLHWNEDIIGSFITNTSIPSVKFASRFTGFSCILVYRAIQKKQHLQIGHLFTILKSFLYLTALFFAGFFILVIMMVTSGKTGILQLKGYVDLIRQFHTYGLPVIWIAISWFWIKKYKEKFINDEAEWMLR